MKRQVQNFLLSFCGAEDGLLPPAFAWGRHDGEGLA